MRERRIGNIYGYDGGNYAGNIYDKSVLSPTIRTYGGGNQQPMIVEKAIRKQYENHEISEQRKNMSHLVPRTDDISNTITTVQKDNLLLSPRVYRIRKLTPRETGRLMNVSDAAIDKMSEVNSNTQLYRQFGNSIVVSVLVAIFSQLNIQGNKAWNDMTESERYLLTNDN